MNSDAEELYSLSGCRPRTFSNASQQSFKQVFPLTASDSGLYTCSSNNSDCSLQLESDSESYQQSNKTIGFRDERLHLAFQDVCKLRSELERLTKSEQWYKQELKQQKSTRLDDLQRIYTQERKFIEEKQRLQKECVRLFEKCNVLEVELEKQYQECHENHIQHVHNEENHGKCVLEFEKEQQLALIKDQQQLISVLRKQKRALLDDLRSLTVSKDERVMELQRDLVDLEFDNKLITKKCTQFAKERLNLENNLKEIDMKFSLALHEKLGLQKLIVDLKDQLETQKQLVKLKESEIEHIQQHYTHEIQNEQDLDKVHTLSMKYQEEINLKTLEIIDLKERLQQMIDKLEEKNNLQQQNELQQRQIDQLSFSLEANFLELQELKMSEKQKHGEIEDLNTAMHEIIKDKELVHKTNVKQQNEIFRLKQSLKYNQEQYEKVQELYKDTQFQLELLEIEYGKIKLQNESDQQEIQRLRSKLKDYLEQTADLTNRIKDLEHELEKALKENSEHKLYAEELREIIKDLKESGGTENDERKIQQKVEVDASIKDLIIETTNKALVDQDLIDLQKQCEKLQENLDFIKENKVFFENNYKEVPESKQQFPQNLNIIECSEKDIDMINLHVEGKKLQDNLDKLNLFLSEKYHILSHINNLQNSNESMEQLVKENEILKKKLYETENETLTLQIKQDINEKMQKYTKMKENLDNHTAKVAYLEECLLENDSKLYKLERKLRIMEEADTKLKEFQLENKNLKEQLRHERNNKSELSKKLVEESVKLEDLKHSLDEIERKGTLTKNQSTQCLLVETIIEENTEIRALKEHILQLQQEQRYFLQQEDCKREERVQYLQKVMDLQNNKIQNLQQHQKDWEDILTSINNAHILEQKTRKELELKRMELEELNQVFAEQNDELKKLEEFTALLDIKRQQEKEQLKLTFQQEINVMKQHLKDCQMEIEQQKLLNQQLEKQNESFQQHINEDFATEVAGYKKEIRELKSKVSRIIEEKEELVEHLKELENENRDFIDQKREAILMPDYSLIKVIDTSSQNSAENFEASKQNTVEDHLRILTKVLEAEYQRKMLRYDEHIHSLLSNLKCLKNSLKANEQKTALLSEEQLKTKEELKQLQNTKRSLEEMRLKYEQSQIIIQELKNTLAVERKKYELSDLGKSSQNVNNGTNYEASNLIDDYKKLIQQSAIVTKRPSTSAILDLIQRSNQCVPNLQKLEATVEDLRSDLQNFLVSYSHKIPTAPLIATASLSVPPSLMDELRAASEGF